jgi:hypothetical protein
MCLILVVLDNTLVAIHWHASNPYELPLSVIDSTLAKSIFLKLSFNLSSATSNLKDFAGTTNFIGLFCDPDGADPG